MLTVSFFRSPAPPSSIQRLCSCLRILLSNISEASYLAHFPLLRSWAWFHCLACCLQLIQSTAKAEWPQVGRMTTQTARQHPTFLWLPYCSLLTSRAQELHISQPNKLPCYFLSTLLLFSSLHFLFPYTVISTLGNCHLFFLNRRCQIFLSLWNPAQMPAKGWINYSVSYARVNLYN